MVRPALGRATAALLTVQMVVAACSPWRPGPALGPNPDDARAQLHGLIDSLRTLNADTAGPTDPWAPPHFAPGRTRLRVALRDGSRAEITAPALEGDSLVGIRDDPYGRLSFYLGDLVRVDGYHGTGVGPVIAIGVATVAFGAVFYVLTRAALECDLPDRPPDC